MLAGEPLNQTLSTSFTPDTALASTLVDYGGPAGPLPIAMAQAAETPSPQPAPPAPVAQTATPKVTAKAPAKTTAAPKTAIKSVTPAAATKLGVPATCSGSYTTQFVCLLNKYRASKGLSALTYNSGLANVALKHSQWMQSTGIFSHEETDGSHLLQRCQRAGIICRGENLAKGASGPQNLLDLWIASPSHNAILLGHYSTIGLGIAGPYVTMLVN